MKKADYEAWLTMPLTREIFALWSAHLKDVNSDLIEGKEVNTNEHVTLMNYASVLGYNKAFRKIQEFEYEDLVETPMENDDDQNQDGVTSE